MAGEEQRETANGGSSSPVVWNVTWVWGAAGMQALGPLELGWAAQKVCEK